MKRRAKTGGTEFVEKTRTQGNLVLKQAFFLRLWQPHCIMSASLILSVGIVCVLASADSEKLILAMPVLYYVLARMTMSPRWRRAAHTYCLAMLFILIILLSPFTRRAFANHCVRHAERMFEFGQTRAAQISMVRAAQWDGNQPKVLYGRSLAALQNEKPKEAVRLLNVAITEGLVETDLLEQAANMFLTQNCYDEAASILQNMLKIAPESPHADIWQQALNFCNSHLSNESR